MKSGGLVFQIKYKETYKKNKETAVGVNMSDSRTLHSLQVAKMNNDVSYFPQQLRALKWWHSICLTQSTCTHNFSLPWPLQIKYRKGSKEGQANYTLPMDMINLSHAKKAQALASDLEYRTKLHDYTVMPDDIKVLQAKKAYSQQSEVRERRRG